MQKLKREIYNIDRNAVETLMKCSKTTKENSIYPRKHTTKSKIEQISNKSPTNIPNVSNPDQLKQKMYILNFKDRSGPGV